MEPVTGTSILVLGARVTDGELDPILEHRLRRAADLIRELRNNGADPTVVVSGRGEAAAMHRWLVEDGVDADRILLEPDATSTNENLERAHALVPDARHWLVVTSDFHRWRTRLWAWHLGIPVTVVAARTPAGQGREHWLREIIATWHSLLRILWRRARDRR